jgi:hypothetical protein
MIAGADTKRHLSRRQRQRQPETDVMIFKIFSPNNLAKKMAFLTQNKAKF